VKFIFETTQIEEIEEKMRAFGIPPGSETALKLFNEAATP